MKNYLFTCVLIVLGCNFGFGQTWKQVSYASFKKEHTQLLEKQPKEMYRLKIKTSIFENIKSSKPIMNEESLLQVYEDNNYSYHSKSAFQLQKGKYKINVDTIDHNVLLSNAINSDMLGYNPSQFEGIDSTRYTFYTAAYNGLNYLRVKENLALSSMEYVTFVYDKTTNRINQLELIYWPANYQSKDIADETREQPRVIIDYSDFAVISSDKALTEEFDSWILQDKQQAFVCREPAYTFYNLLEKK